MTDNRLGHLAYMPDICAADIQQLNEKDSQYGGSWKSRGGVGAFMMLARKWDRLENMMKETRNYFIPERVGAGITPAQNVIAGAYDIFAHTRAQEAGGGNSEALRDTIGDLRRYLLLVEAEIDRQIADKEPIAGTKINTGAPVWDPNKPADVTITANKLTNIADTQPV